jgi:membrane associated rhomboid family serine protease
MTPTSVGMRCPECSKHKTKVVRRGYAPGDPVLTYGLIAMNVLVYFGSVISGSSVAGGGFGGSQVIADGGLSRAAIHNGELWRLVTSGFLHAGLFHLLFNMYALYILGQLLEPAVGKLRFGVIYFVSLLAGSFGALLLQPTGLTVGASGAVFGLMGAAIVVMRHRGIDAMQSGLGVWLFLNLAITFTISGISIGGHLGGLAGGVLAALLLVQLPHRVRMPKLAPVAMAVAIGAASVVGAIAVAAS